MLSSLLHSPMSFFDTTPLGRIMNRFTQDFSIVDSMLRMNIFIFSRAVMATITSVIAICYTAPIFIAALVPLSILYYLIQVFRIRTLFNMAVNYLHVVVNTCTYWPVFSLQKFYIITANQLRRLLSVRTSPIYSHFEETVVGATSIRAYDEQKTFISHSDLLIDNMQMAKYPTITTNRWLSVSLEILGNFTVLFTCFYAVSSKDSISGGIAGLAITYALQVGRVC